mmetsp:Transcript_41226/g.122338  ORF Transcript_41226/g.122338 Transcript_41226/m.122338 type:complete len:257 (-) Transcript_41226:1127-1897(-)
MYSPASRKISEVMALCAFQSQITASRGFCISASLNSRRRKFLRHSLQRQKRATIARMRPISAAGGSSDAWTSCLGSTLTHLLWGSFKVLKTLRHSVLFHSEHQDSFRKKWCFWTPHCGPSPSQAWRPTPRFLRWNHSASCVQISPRHHCVETSFREPQSSFSHHSLCTSFAVFESKRKSAQGWSQSSRGLLWLQGTGPLSTTSWPLRAPASISYQSWPLVETPSTVTSFHVSNWMNRSSSGPLSSWFTMAPPSFRT